MFNQISLPITKHQLKVFIGTSIAIFIMMVLYNLGISSPFLHFQTPKTKAAEPTKEDILKTITPRLQEKKNNFKLNRESHLIQQAHAERQSNFEGAPSYLVADLDTGKIIAEKNSEQAIHIASITKIMTAVIALDLAAPEEVFTVSEHAAAYPPTKIVITPGEKITLEELLHASLLTSANDATEEIKHSIDKKYRSEIFIEAMNKKAQLIGMKNTHFGNAQGFDFGDNHSSAKDVALLTQYAMENYPLIRDIVIKDFQLLPASNNHKEFTLYNWNGLLGVYPDIIGAKIGNTVAAGFTTSVVSARNGKKIAAIVLGAPGVLERDLWAAELLDLGYNQTLGLPPVGITEDQLIQKYNTWQYN